MLFSLDQARLDPYFDITISDDQITFFGEGASSLITQYINSVYLTDPAVALAAVRLTQFLFENAQQGRVISQGEGLVNTSWYKPEGWPIDVIALLAPFRTAPAFDVINSRTSKPKPFYDFNVNNPFSYREEW
jgi:hypothetical protein